MSDCRYAIFVAAVTSTVLPRCPAAMGCSLGMFGSSVVYVLVVDKWLRVEG